MGVERKRRQLKSTTRCEVMRKKSQSAARADGGGDCSGARRPRPRPLLSLSSSKKRKRFVDDDERARSVSIPWHRLPTAKKNTAAATVRRGAYFFAVFLAAAFLVFLAPPFLPPFLAPFFATFLVAVFFAPPAFFAIFEMLWVVW